MKKSKFILFLSIFILIIITVIGIIFFMHEKSERNRESTTQRPTVSITFPEGYTVSQIAELLEENKVCKAKDFIEAAKTVPTDFKFASNIQNSDKRYLALEGYIFPDTYEFYVDEGAKNALSRFLKNTESKITDKDVARAAEMGLTVDQIITLASIIQSEASVQSQMSTVASVFYNRIKSPSYGKLQSDATINYIEKYVRPLIGSNADNYAAYYNTYKCAGLPVGAICNPGKAAIQAALYPADTEYYFFVTDDNSNYYYAKTFSEHQQNCKNIKNSTTAATTAAK